VREICMLRSTRRGLETGHGRDGVTLADERARQRGTQTSTYTGAPVLDPTDERGWETGRWPKAQATAPILDSTRSGPGALKGGLQFCGESWYTHGWDDCRQIGMEPPMRRLADWLEKLGMPEYAQRFAQNGNKC
jgi:hypothetical protein